MSVLRRYPIILPSEHGAWAMLVTPFVIGAGVAGQLSLPLWLCAIAALALFLARQPLALLVRLRRGKARAADRPSAWLWAGLLLAIAAVSGIALLLIGRWAILWLALPAGGIMAATLLLGSQLGPRQLLVELIGVTGLALAAPAAYVAATGHLDATAGVVWVLSALYGLITVVYVRLRIDETHRRASGRQRIAVVAAHAGALMGVATGALVGWLPALVVVPLSLLLVRAVYAGWRQLPVANVRRFGLAETGFALAFACLVILAFVQTR